MPRPQFSIRTLLWLTLVVAEFLGGMFTKEEILRREQAAISADKRWRVPGARRHTDGTFRRSILSPDGNGYTEEILAPIP